MAATITESGIAEARKAALLLCSNRFTCPAVFDWYNTDGDCLMEK